MERNWNSKEEKGTGAVRKKKVTGKVRKRKEQLQ